MSPGELLAHARALLQEETLSPSTSWSRGAAFLARQALEGAVRSVLERRYTLDRRATFRAQLLALRAVMDEELAAEVHFTWASLSRATHHHAYALPPTVGELDRWMEVVERLVEFDEKRSGQ